MWADKFDFHRFRVSFIIDNNDRYTTHIIHRHWKHNNQPPKIPLATWKHNENVFWIVSWTMIFSELCVIQYTHSQQIKTTIYIKHQNKSAKAWFSKKKIFHWLIRFEFLSQQTRWKLTMTCQFWNISFDTPLSMLLTAPEQKKPNWGWGTIDFIVIFVIHVYISAALLMLFVCNVSALNDMNK